MPPEIQGLLPYFVNFAIVIVLLVLMTRKSLRKFVYQRHERMRDSFASAAMAHKGATDRAESAKRSLAAIQSEESALLQEEVMAANQEAREILEKADAEVRRVVKETDRLVGVEQDEASSGVRGQFLALVVRETEENLRRGLKKDDHTAILKRAQMSIEVGV